MYLIRQRIILHRLQTALMALLMAVLLVPSHAIPQETRSSGLSPEQAKALADLLRDDAAREALLQQLDAVGSVEAAESGAPATAPEPEKVSIGRRIALTSQQFAEGVATSAIRFWEQLGQVPNALGAVSDLGSDVILDALLDLALVLLVTLVVFNVLRSAARRLYTSMGTAAEGTGATRASLIIAASIVFDTLVVVLAWGIGYAVTLLMLGETGSIGIRQTLFLNAFFLVEMIKVFIRAVLSPSTASLRPVSLQDRPARILSGWLSLLVGLVGYGQLLAVPIVNQNVSWLAGRSLSTMISLVAVAILIGLVFYYRKAVGTWLSGASARGGLLRFIARNWHVPTLMYLLFLFAIVLARPGGILIPSDLRPVFSSSLRWICPDRGDGL